MTFPHTHVLQELGLLSSAARAAHRPRRAAPWRQRVRALGREHPQLTVFTVDADEVTSQLASHGRR
jgi:hypothetical protein